MPPFLLELKFLGMGQPNTLFTFFIIRPYTISSSLCVTQEILRRRLSFLLEAVVPDVSHCAHGDGHDSPLPPRKHSLLLYLPTVKETSWQLRCIYNAVRLVLQSLCYISTDLSPLSWKMHPPLSYREKFHLSVCSLEFSGERQTGGILLCETPSILSLSFQTAWVVRAGGEGELMSPKTRFPGSVS